MKPAVLDRPTSAAYLAVSVRKLDKLVEEKRIARIKIDAKTVFAVEELDRFLEEQKGKSDE